ncbi:hypothetical protein Pmar_PMAR009934 [Perkinsus marinus ATCC 50983]|uniref:Uncharacterized protein n=1 Tax=Perkinsus marinus (strain ATCC 50983 / TXsc) TaxID=423536 RepID=C5LI96_PERM5|nr:hypothetical protein Pmar_PMAR009934 [Perkinsus marinus ATCC 50983]EER03544.1 hypothetical protein Pmar_PMAR009934 [Perkinsus marinus ATCC 50983]|eukprot:XP_002771728.1 hypothetical protein Pmar_PMAR009934 [Perkinsus marinus ATCC 50983]
MPPLQDHVPLDDYIDALCSNAFNGQGLDLTRAKYTVVGSGIPGMVFGIVRGTGGYVYGINYMEAEQWSEVTHVLVGPKVHAGSLRNICHTLRQLSLTDKVIWVDCRDLLTPTDQGSVGGWTPTSILAALTSSKRTLGSSREASKRVKGSPTRSSPPVTPPPNTSVVPSPPTRPSIYKTAEDDRIRRPLVLCPVVVTTSRTTFQPAPQIMTLCDADPLRDVDLSPTFQGSRRTYFDGSPLGGGGGQQRRRRSPSPGCDAPIIPGVTVTPGKHRQRRRRRRAVGGYREVADVMTAAPRRSTRLSRSAPPKGGLSRVVSLPTFAT